MASSPVEPTPTADTVAANAQAANVDDDTDPQALGAIRDELDGYGSWSDDADYGSVWTPNEVAFIPYVTDGRWVTVGTNEPIWLANSTWGAVTTHHGRWVATPSVGVAAASSTPRWRWVPGVKLQSSWAAWHTPTTPTTIWRSEVAEKLGTAVAAPAVETKASEVTVPTRVQEAVPEVRVAQATTREDVVQATEATSRTPNVDGSATSRTVEDAPRDLRMAWNGTHAGTSESVHVSEGGHFAHSGGSTSSSHASSGGHGGHR